MPGGQAILNPHGREIAGEITEYVEKLRSNQVLTKQDIKAIERLISQIPSLEEPHLELFCDPLEGIPEEMLYVYKNIHLEITTGCTRQCLFCNVCPQRKLVHMPYPMVLKMLDAIQKATISEDEDVLLFFASDPFEYYDNVLGADLSDVVKAAMQRSLKGVIRTSGWAKGNKKAQRAAERLVQLPYDFGGVEVTVHPFFSRTLAKVKAYLMDILLY